MSTESQIQSFRDAYAALQSEIAKVIVGHTEIVGNTLTALGREESSRPKPVASASLTGVVS